MKSYLKFLSRNKLYTAIEAVGLIVSLAFVVIISCYVWQQLAITRETPGYKNVYSLTTDKLLRKSDIHRRTTQPE